MGALNSRLDLVRPRRNAGSVVLREEEDRGRVRDDARVDVRAQDSDDGRPGGCPVTREDFELLRALVRDAASLYRRTGYHPDAARLERLEDDLVACADELVPIPYRVTQAGRDEELDEELVEEIDVVLHDAIRSIVGLERHPNLLDALHVRVGELLDELLDRGGR